MLSLARRALYACRDCYAIGQPGPFEPPSARNIPAPYVRDAVAVLHRADRLRNRFTPDFNIDAAFVGTMDDGILVAFRGTLPPALPVDAQTAADWLNNFDAIPCPGPAEFRGMIHEGFRGSGVALWAQILPEVERRLAGRTDVPLYIAGHSKGGALANLAAWLCLDRFAGVPIRVITFGAARCGDQAFANDFQASGDIVCDRYEYGWDVVPYLPLGGAPPPFLRFLDFHPALERFVRGYVPVGNLTYGGREGSLGTAIVRRLGALIHGERQTWPAVIADHLIGPGSGYESLVASVERR
jgi:hypothetical protein